MQFLSGIEIILAFEYTLYWVWSCVFINYIFVVINNITMKKIILLCFLYSTFSYSQTEIKVGEFYTINKNIDVIELETNSMALNTFSSTSILSFEDYKNKDALAIKSNNLVTIEANWRIKIIKIDNGIYAFNVVNQANFESRIFGMTKTEILTYATKYKYDMPKHSFVTSAITIPIKIRPGDGENSEDTRRYFDFEGNVNIGIAAGYRIRLSKTSKQFLSLLTGISIGSTKITPESVTEDFMSETNASTLTPFLGVIYEYDNFEIGLFTGWDHLGGRIGKNWVYQGKTWIGIGLGYNIFTSKAKE